MCGGWRGEERMPNSTTFRLATASIALCLGGANAMAAVPAVSASPRFNPPSTSTNASGTGFGATEAVDLYFDTTDEALVVTNASGAFASTALAVPAAAPPGTHWITAVGRHSGLAAQVSFTVRTDWAQQGYGAANKAFNPYENVLSPQNVAALGQVWSVTGTFGPPTEYEGKLLIPVETGKANVAALNPGSGTTIWSKTVSSIDGGGLSEAGGSVFFGNGASIEALKVSNGAVAWTANEGQIIVGPVTAAAGAVYAGGASGTLFALNESTGATLWTGKAAENGTFGRPTVANAFGQETVYAPCGAGLCVLNETGDVYDATDAGAPTPMTVSNGSVFFGDNQGTLWSYPIDSDLAVFLSGQGSFTAAPAAANDALYAGSQTNLYAFDQQLGQIWSADVEASSQPAVANGVVYVGDSLGSLYAFNAASGALLWSAQIKTLAPITGNIVVNGMLFATDASGDLFAYALNAGNNAIYHRNPKPPARASLHPDLSLSPGAHHTFRSADEQ